MTVYHVQAGDQSSWQFALLQNSAAFTLAGATSVTLYKKAHTTGTVAAIATTDSSPKLTIDSPASAGIVTLAPGSDTWVASDLKYTCWLKVVAGGKSYFFANDSSIEIEVTQ